MITGAGRGIGQAIANLFAANGAIVHILDIDAASAGAAAKQISDAGGQASSAACDVGDLSAVKAACAAITHSGRVHILVNSAGIAHVGTLESTSEAEFDAVFRVNVKGTYFCMQALVSHMKQMGGGVILNLASIVATRALPDRFVYSASKGAVLSMTLSVAKDYLHHNIRCNCVSPARVHTPFVDGFVKKNYPGKEKEMFEKLARAQPIGRMGRPEEVAALALYLCSGASSFVTGADFPLDGGFFNLCG